MKNSRDTLILGLRTARGGRKGRGEKGWGLVQTFFFFVLSTVAISAAASVTCQSFLQPPTPVFNRKKHWLLLIL